MKSQKKYSKQWTRSLPLLNIEATLYVHNQTGAEIIHLKNDDDNKCFAIGFQTIPASSNGVAHILEHSVLAGSQKYPVKDPFALLMKSSLKTFINAFTYSDKTIYPVASQNDQDLKNLIGVYLDAVFFPLLTEKTLAQEGWHFEIDDKTKKLTYKGVVYNEMKGAYSNVDNIIEDKVFTHTLPDTCYSVDSGGNPEEIPTLTHEALREFHSTQYHPSNATVVLYGDLAVNEYLALIDTYFEKFEGRQAVNRVGIQKRFNEPVIVNSTIPVSEDKEKTGGASVFAWLLGDSNKPEGTQKDRFAWSILSYLLLESDASPFKKALLESQLGESIVGSGVELDVQQPLFYFGLRNVDPHNFEKVEQLVCAELEKVVKSGIEKRLLESVLSKVEFEYREMQSGGYPKGISLYTTMMQSWLYGRDPLESLAIEGVLQEIKQEVANESSYFIDLVKSGLLQNLHKVTFRLSPDKDYQEKAAQKEQEKLQEIQASLTATEFSRLEQETKDFEAYQKAGDDESALKTLPKLEVADISKEIMALPTEVEKVKGVTYLKHPITSNGIVYLDFVFDIAHLSTEQLGKLQLLGEYLFRLNTTQTKSEELALLLDLYAGGYDTGYFVKTKFKTKLIEQKFVVSVKCLIANVSKVMDILMEILTKLDFSDSKKIMQILLEVKAEEESSLIHDGHVYALNYSRAAISKAYEMSQNISGLAFVENLKSWALKHRNNATEFADEIKELYKLVLHGKNLLVNVTADEIEIPQVIEVVRKGVVLLSNGVIQRGRSPKTSTNLPRRAAFVIPAQISFQAYSLPLPNTDKISFGNLSVIAKYIGLEFLWKKVRQLGGAYGCWVSFDYPNELMTFVSYRDPSIRSTFETYATVADYILEAAEQLTSRDIDDCIIGAISQIDAPLTAEEKGYTALANYLSGIDDAYRQRLRNEVLSTTKEDFIAFAHYFKSIDQKKTSRTSLTGKELLDVANAREMFDTVRTI